MVTKIARWIIAKRRWVYAVIFPATLFLIYQMRYIKIYFEREDLTPNKHLYMKLHHKMEEVFGGANTVAIGIRVKDGDIFNPVTLDKIYRISDKLYFLRGIIRYKILGLTSMSLVYSWTTVDEQGTPFHHHKAYLRIVQDIFKTQNLEEKKKKIESFKEVALKDPFVGKGIISKDLKGTVIYADFWWERDYRYIYQKIKEITEAETDDNHSFHFVGRPIELGYIDTYVKKMLTIFGIAMVVILLLLFSCFRTWRGVWIPFFGAFIALVWLLGFCGLFRVRLDVFSLCVPFIAMAIATSHSVQIIKRYYEEFLKTKNKVIAAETTLEGLIEPALAAVVTDGLGFASLALFDIRILRSLGISMGLGIISIFLVVTILIHCLLATLPAPTEKAAQKAMKEGILDVLLRRFALISLSKNRWAVFAGALIILIIGFAGSQRVITGFIHPGVPTLWPNSKYNQDDRVINEHFLGTDTYNIYVDAGADENLFMKPEIDVLVDKLQRHLEKRPYVGATLSYVDEIKKLSRAYYEVPTIPREPVVLHDCFERWVGRSEPDGTRAYMELDFRQANIHVFMKGHTTNIIEDVIKDTEEFIKANNHTEAKIIPAAGLIGMYKAIIDEIRHKTLWDTLLITIVIFICCAFGFRSFWGGIAVLLPLGISKVLTYGIMGYFEEGLFLASVAIMAPGMGVGVDYAIYTLARLKEEMAKKGQDPKEAFVVALTTAGKAVFYTAMSVALGVIVLWFSEIRIQAVMGGLLAVVIILNMLAALLVLPSLIATWKPRFIYG